ncbi:Protein of unknown function [Pyronema omphalodes CBS 100304]|uniref:Uncharacterized protein n=1 Tax=Pyronema omphalodes (strain CBS 100304) TaxID=1076935 RepID=U4LJP8_PYROM|nr:Protein of unknown function [Pyronema omphalodes CBS 100304]
MATDMAINMASRVLDNIPELEELQSLSSRMVKHTNSQDSDRFPGYQIILDWLEYLQDVRPGSLIDDDYKFALDQMMSDITEFDGAEGLDELHAQIFEDPDYLKIPDDRHHMELQSMLQVASARARYKTRAEAQAAVVAALQEKLMARRKAKKLPAFGTTGHITTSKLADIRNPVL